MSVSSAASVHYSTSSKKCPHTEAVFRRTSNGYARIYFMKNSMNAEVIAAFFQHGHFRIDHAFEIPESIVQNLQLSEHRVGPGLYRMRAYKDFYIIDLDPSGKSHGTAYMLD
jgi:hypothetical protein